MTTASDAVAVRDGEQQDWLALQEYLRAALPGLGGEFVVRQFPHGAANLTYLVECGPTRLVVRRPPLGNLAPGAHDMRREYRVLSRLHRSYDRAPRAVLFCDDSAVLGAPFLVEEFRAGVVVRAEVPSSFRSAANVGARVGAAVIDALSDLHLVDPAACSLEDLGRPDGFVARQHAGWIRRWELVADSAEASPVATLGTALGHAVPAPQRVSVLHLDFKIDNCQFGAGDPGRVTSVFDWDMATLGDPLIDLGTLLNYWPEAGDDVGSQATQAGGLEHEGLPTRAEVVERYATRSGLDCGQIAWYEAFGCWKTAIALRQLEARYLRGQTTDLRMRGAGRAAAPLARRGLQLLGAE